MIEDRYTYKPGKLAQSYRTGILFNLKIEIIVGVAVIAPILLALVTFQIKDYFLWKNFASTLILAGVTYFATNKMIPIFMLKHIKADMYGKDLNKPGMPEDKPKVPEGLGILSAAIFLLTSIIPQIYIEKSNANLVNYNSALLSICLMTLLGFVDDILDLPWRYKLILPTVASLPLLVAYTGPTSIVVPKIVTAIFGDIVDMGLLYHVYMGMLAVFCTDSINIYAGINGIEVGQSIIIACAMVLHNVIEIGLNSNGGIIYQQHIFSMTIMIPFIFASIALFKYNKFPSLVFVGDTYCNFAGMTFAVAGILGHCSKTMLLFFLPQVINFLLSLPQIMGYPKCPRHRLPKMNKDTYKMECVHNHFTLINAFLRIVGPTNEDQTCRVLLIFQIACCGLAFFIRYGIASYFY